MRLSVHLLKDATRKFKLVVAGSGAGGSAIANYFSRTIAISQIAVIDPLDKIYYQPGFSLIAGNMLDPKEVERSRKDFHPDLVEWYRKEVKEFAPKKNKVILSDGTEVEYEFLVISTGTTPRFDLIEGLPEAFKERGVCSIYDYKLAQKTRDEIQNFKGGNAIFTHPNGHIKCAGATQKICYLAEDIFRKNGIRDKSVIVYNTALDKVFGIERYADTLVKLIDKKHIIVHTQRALSKVDPTNKVAYFDVLDDNAKPTGKTDEIQYELLHVSPPCLPIMPLIESAKSNDGLTNAEGWVDVDDESLQSKKYSNIFALGDCISSPNAKTAAAASVQFKVVKKNLENMMNDKQFSHKYDGYSSCPFLTDRKHGMLAEFDYKGQNMETLPLSQNKPRYLFYLMSRHLLPFIYWKLFLKGFWTGPEGLRKVLHLGFSK